MDPGRKRRIRLLVRLFAYVVVLGLLFQARQGVDWRHLFSRAPTEGAPPNTLILAGRDLAPGLVTRLVDAYRADFPRVRIEFRPGGTRAALEELVNRRCDVALTVRPVTAGEQRIFVDATGDSALATPFALGGLVLVTAAAPPAGARGEPWSPEPVGLSALGDLAAGRSTAEGSLRLYVSDPNDGLWAALLARLAPSAPDSVRPPGVVFLADPAAVLEAVRNDPGALGLASTLALPDSSELDGVRTVPLREAPGATAIEPTYENIGNARYPMFHYLYAVSRPGGGLEGNMFITHLASLRGQRQVERFGHLPARQALRPIVLTTHPVGEAQ
jgi:ABC-type phosphate transport system substrate-binding protein